MQADPVSELLSVRNRKDLSESGGGHNQKGVNFQRYWAIFRMFELEKSGANDFLLLFEAIQDIAVLDSPTTPTSISIYQVKKKDRNEWKWSELTSLNAPGGGGKKKTKQTDSIKNSPLGKLYRTVVAFKVLQSSGHFISNAGCDLPMADGSKAATSVSCNLSDLAVPHRDLLSNNLETLHEPGDPSPNLSILRLGKTNIPVDDPSSYLVGKVHTFLAQRSPTHAGQAQALVEALMAKISPLGARTDTCKNFDELRQQHGYTKGDLAEALGTLQSIPDVQAILNEWLEKLTAEGLSLIDTMSVRIAAAEIYRRQLTGVVYTRDQALSTDCESWVQNHPTPTQLVPFLQEAFEDISPTHPGRKRSELFAHLLIQAIKKCVALT